MIEIDDISVLMARFPDFELSYETISHKKVCDSYDICMAIPTGRKAYIWFTYYYEHNICILFELNKEKRIVKHELISTPFNWELSLGTLYYGTVVFDKIQNKRWFVAEDILYYQGIPLRRSKIMERMLFMELSMKLTERKHANPSDMIIMFPTIWNSNKMDPTIAKIPDNIYCYIPYQVHHIQYRSTKEFKPFINMLVNNKIIGDTVKRELTISVPIVENTLNTSHPQLHPSPHPHPPSRNFVMDLTKPQYKYNTIFQVKADIQYDIYNLYAFGKNKTSVLYNVAYVPNYKSSVFLNGLFRQIRENKNLDYIEESDDEADFENTKEDKYVDLNKTLLMECIFHNKFKKWIPIKVVDKKFKVVHISSLVKFR